MHWRKNHQPILKVEPGLETQLCKIPLAQQIRGSRKGAIVHNERNSLSPVAPYALHIAACLSRDLPAGIIAAKTGLTASGLHRCGQLAQKRFGIFPANTGISDTFAVDQLLAALQALVPFH